MPLTTNRSRTSLISVKPNTNYCSCRREYPFSLPVRTLGIVGYVYERELPEVWIIHLRGTELEFERFEYIHFFILNDKLWGSLHRLPLAAFCLLACSGTNVRFQKHSCRPLIIFSSVSGYPKPTFRICPILKVETSIHLQIYECAYKHTEDSKHYHSQ